MNSRERVLASIRHQEPDRVPLDLGSLASTIEAVPYNRLKKYLGLELETVTFLRDHAEPNEEILSRFSIDTRYIRINPPANFKIVWEPDNSYVDEWGTRWTKPDSSHYFDPVPPFPLESAEIKDIDRHNWPDPDDPGRYVGLKERAKALRENTDFAIVADIPFLGPLEFCWLLLRGYEYFIDLLANKPFATALMEKVTDIQIRMYSRYMEEVGKYVDVVCVSEDLGDQERLMMSLDLYREMVKPHHKKLWGTIKSKTDAYLFHHSCGSVADIIPDLVELGVDILNPVQVSAKGMDSAQLKSKYGSRITFWGGIDTHHVMPHGSPQDVEEEVQKRIKDFAPGGGYILSAVHNIQSDVDPVNIVRMYDAAIKYGKYPIR